MYNFTFIHLCNPSASQFSFRIAKIRVILLIQSTGLVNKTITLETKELVDFTFVWFTDGQGWKSARNNLEETFDVLEHIYNISDMENGIINEVMK